MSKGKKFLVFSQENSENQFLVRHEVHKALDKWGIIEKLSIDDERIEILENSKTSKLKKIAITPLNYRDDKSEILEIWRVNLEKEIPGISTQGKSPEIALLILQRYFKGSYRLNILLIELKSSLQSAKNKSGRIQSSTLQDIHEKFRCAMNRMYMLLTLNDHKNSRQGYDQKTIYIEFKGLVFYSENKINQDDSSDLYPILNNSNKSGLLSCSTLLQESDKINVKFFFINDPDSDLSTTVSLEDLLIF